MSRLSYVDPAQLSGEQKELYDSIAAGPRAAKRASLVDAEGRLTGPVNGFLHLPALGKHWSAIGEGLRFRSNLDRGLFELAILIIAVHWRSGHEWAAHARLAREAGIDQAVIDAIRLGERPVLRKPDEDAVFRVVHELVNQPHVGDFRFATGVSVLGEEQV